MESKDFQLWVQFKKIQKFYLLIEVSQGQNGKIGKLDRHFTGLIKTHTHTHQNTYYIKHLGFILTGSNMPAKKITSFTIHPEISDRK